MTGAQAARLPERLKNAQKTWHKLKLISLQTLFRAVTLIASEPLALQSSEPIYTDFARNVQVKIMNSTEWQKIKEIFNKAIDLPEAERAAFLEKHDEIIIEKVKNLLKANEDANDFIVESAFVDVGLIDENETDLYIGKQIDDYKILEEIGHGGMGTVYLAAKRDESFEKKVAIKLIKRGMDTNAVLKRFVLERKILAGLENPNIASLLDGGSTEDGLPYLVMELVEGVPVTKFCDLNQFSIEERLELFRKVCSAISYAHQNLVIHRDIKPSNILVTKDGIPKLLDFGIAKLLHPDWSLETDEATATMFRLMTPEYASPEQIRGLPITTASDVYSLGVVLYELLSGERPYKIESRLPQEVANIILTEEPIRPSLVVSPKSKVQSPKSKAGTLTYEGQETVGQKTNPQSTIHNPKSLRGDLDNIILKALRKEPERRYQSVQEFSEDIRRHLAGLPVTATADTTFYRIGKFIQRHKVGVLTTVSVSLLLLLTTTFAVWQAVRANEERARAERRFAETRKIANSLLFEIHDSLKDLPGATASREILVNRALEYLDTLSQEADDNPELLYELAVAYRKVGEIQGDPYFSNLGQSSTAVQSLQKAFEIQEKLVKSKPENIDLQRQIGLTTFQLGDNYYLTQNNFDEALKYFRRSQTAYKIVASAEPLEGKWKSALAVRYVRSASVLSKKSEYAAANDDFKNAQKLNDEALAMSPENLYVLASCSEIYTSIGNNLGNPDYNDLGKTDEALEVLQKALSIRKKISEKEPNNTLYKNFLGITLKDLGDVYLAKGDVAGAIENYRESLTIHQTIAGKDAKDALAQGTVGYDLTKLGNALLANGELENALKNHEQSVAILEKLHLGDTENDMFSYTFAFSLEGLGNALKAKKDYSKGLIIYKRSVEILEKLNSKASNTEFEIKIAQLHFKLGQTRQLLYNSNTANENLCQEAKTDFQKSVEIFAKIQNLTALSPTNAAIFSQAKQGAENIKCEK